MSEAKTQAEVQIQIVEACEELKAILLSKNEAYGNSVMDPIRVFSEAEPWEQILVRLDDKLTRIKRGRTYGQEDTVLDLLGYALFLWICLREARTAGKTEANPTPTRLDETVLFKLMTGRYVHTITGTESRMLIAILSSELIGQPTVQASNVDPQLSALVVGIRTLKADLSRATAQTNQERDRLRESLFQLRAVINRAKVQGNYGELDRWLQMAGEGGVSPGAELRSALQKADDLQERLNDADELIQEKVQHLETLEGDLKRARDALQTRDVQLADNSEKLTLAREQIAKLEEVNRAAKARTGNP